MDELKNFMKENKEVKEDELFAVSESFKDAKGEPRKWRLRHISSKEYKKLTKDCTHEEQIPGKRDQYRTVVDQTKLTSLLCIAAVVFPDLRDKELQDSYGVKNPEDLLDAMVDSPGELTNLFVKITDMNEFDKDINDKVEKVKK